jgi:periplasmic protein CpxP/Spy
MRKSLAASLLTSSQLQSSPLSLAVAALGFISAIAIIGFAIFSTPSAQAQDAMIVAQASSVSADSTMAHRGGANALARSEQHAARRMDRMFDRIKATPEQREKIRTVMSTSKTDASAQHQARLDNKRAMGAALAAPTIDRAAIEKLRVAQLTQAEAQSKKRTDTMVAIAEVLTPEQRQEMAKMMTMRGDKRGHRGPGHQQRVGMMEEDAELLLAMAEQE